MTTRFCPSPTGPMHMGNVRTALLNRLLAERDGSAFLLRIEDTDAERCSVEHEQQLMDDLRWLGLDWDEDKLLRQSERGDIYAEYLQRLRSEGHLYSCFCSDEELQAQRRAQLSAGRPPRYAGTCANLSEEQVALRRSEGATAAMRFRVPPGRTLTTEDMVRGTSSISTDLLGDFVVLRRDGAPTFLFCNALDDALSGVTLAVRGEDHLSNTPRQHLLMEALGFTPPRHGHLSMLVGEEGRPLSKRDGTGSVRALREQGYLPQALLNYLFRLGHSGVDSQLLTLQEMVSALNPDRLSRSPARWLESELRHWQKLAVEGSSVETLVQQWFAPDAPFALDEALQGEALQGGEVSAADLVTALHDNLLLPTEVAGWAVRLLGSQLQPSPEALDKIRLAGGDFFAQAEACSQGAAEDWSGFVAVLKERSGLKGAQLFRPLRAALSGEVSGPELERIAALLGQSRLQERLRQAAQLASASGA